MADTIDVELRAKTDAAVTEVRKFNTEIRDATTAATVAGSAQQQLGKDVAVTASKQREAAEAVRAAKQALETHSATVGAFGARSEQAAQSAAKLAAAEREAQKAAAVAADALAKVAKEAQAVAAAEDGQLSPATKRAAAQVARMGEAAERTTHDLSKMELQQKKGAGGFDLLGLASGKLMSVIGPAALGGTLVALAGWIGEAAEKTLQYETAIGNLPFKLEGAIAATRGLMSESKLAVSASQALALGVVKTEGEFNQLAADAAKIALKLGTSTDQMLGDLTTALGRGSAMILDNAGIILKVSDANEAYAASVGKTVAQLDEAEKKIAFQTAAMAAIRKSAGETTVAYDSNAAAVVRLKVKVGDAWDAMGRGASNGVGALVGVVESSVSAIGDFEQSFIKTAVAMDTTWSPAFRDGAAATGKWAADLLLAGDAAEVMAQFLNPGNIAEMEAANAKEREKRDLLSEEAEFSERMAKAAAEVEKANTAFLDAQAAAAVVYGPAEAPKKKKAGPKKKAEEFSSNSGTNAIVRGFDGVGATEQIASAAPEAAAEGRAEREAQLFEQETLRNERAMEMLVDRVGLEAETEARRATLVDQQLAREAKLAQWQAQNARTTAQREQALTRMEEVEHRKRVLAAQREAAEERKLAEQRQATFERIGGAASSLSATVVAATWEQAQGQKGAIAMMLGDRLKGISIDATVTAAWETAQGVAALAGIYTAGLAPGHFAAAAEAAGVAILAGTAGAGLGAAGKAASGGGAGGASSRAPSTAPATGAPGGGNTGGGSTSSLERMDVPISYDRPGASSSGPVININVQGPVGKDTVRAIGETVRRAIDKTKAQGPRP